MSFYPEGFKEIYDMVRLWLSAGIEKRGKSEFFSKGGVRLFKLSKVLNNIIPNIKKGFTNE